MQPQLFPLIVLSSLIVSANASAAGPSGPGALDGSYTSSGKSAEGKKFSGRVTLKRVENSYTVTWHASGEKGIGVLHDEHLVVAYQGKSWFGIIIYTIQRNRRLVGRFIPYGGKGKFGTETLEPEDP
ncbi:MAG: hypothetical protein HYY84_06095 [Deltaproteobacteria bacterium]|nr:hypothetical protein [Deltaproteobacteria bacterium]